MNSKRIKRSAMAARSVRNTRRGLDRALTSRELAWRKWRTCTSVTALLTGPGALLDLGLWWAGYEGFVAWCATGAVATVSIALAYRFWPLGPPRVWQTLGDAEMVRLLELARLYSQVGALVHQVNEQGRDFALQDWLQAQAIELQVGTALQALAAADAQRRLRAGATAWAQP